VVVLVFGIFPHLIFDITDGAVELIARSVDSGAVAAGR